MGDEIKGDEMGRAGGGGVYSYRVLVEELEVKRPCRRLRPEWEDNIKMYLKGKG
jgi:hypothetical protein